MNEKKVSKLFGNELSAWDIVDMKEYIEQIHERNRRVEADKSWETSKTRRVVISLMTYFTVVLFLWLIEAPRPFVNALVPTLGFILSTLTLSGLKKIWLRSVYRK